MKTYCKTGILIIILLSMVISCRKVHTYPSIAIIVNRLIDTTLNDSALIFGYVYSAEDEKTPELNANIWIEDTNIKTNSDSSGFFSLKLLSGTYTIKCLGKYSNEDMIIELKNLSILPNERIEVKFLQGVIIE
ncbi:MAG: hypothetical protein STSR0006_00170 [Lentimicrobium sp.]